MEERTKAKLFFSLQQKVKKIGVDATNEHFKFDYVTLGKLLTTLHPIFEELELTYSQPLVIRDGKNALRTEIVDIRSGDIIAESEAFLIVRSDNNPQDFGGAITYQRRYQLFSLLGLVGDKDDDCQLTNKEIEKRVQNANSLGELMKIFTSIPQDQQKELNTLFSQKKTELAQNTLQAATIKE